jgi:2-oxoglutarate dehydrogenase E1 component
VLRRQMIRDFRKPLVVFTPKSLLRHPKCISSVEELTKGKFSEVFDDKSAEGKIKKVILCSGKLYYDLIEYSGKNKVKGFAVVRMEQLYPLPVKQLNKIIEKYKGAKLVWAQEEPENMGAWGYIKRVMKDFRISGITRHESPSPATGSHKTHEREQKELIETVFSA